MEAHSRAKAAIAAAALVLLMTAGWSTAYADEQPEAGSTQVTVISDASPVEAAQSFLAKTADSLGPAAPAIAGACAVGAAACATAAAVLHRARRREGGEPGDAE